MFVEGQMRSVHGNVVLDESTQPGIGAAGKRLEPVPEHSVMQNQEVDFLLDCVVDDARREINRSCRLRYHPVVLELQPVERVAEVGDGWSIEKLVEVSGDFECG